VSRRDKLIERIRARPPEADFDDVRKLLERFGFAVAGGKGSHVRFAKVGERSIVVPTRRGRKVAREYLD